MSVQTGNSKTISQDAMPTKAPSETLTRLHGRWLLFARVAWFAIIGLTVGLYLLSVPITYAKTLSICTAGQCDPSQLTPQAILELQQLGLSPNFFAVYFTLTNVLFVLVSLSVAVVIFWRRSNDWMALLGSLMLVTFGIATFSGSLDNLVASYPALQPINDFINFCGAASLLLFFYLFPIGRFEPHWSRWLLLLFLAVGILSALIPSMPKGDNGPGTFFIPLASILFVQIYRYWKVLGRVERQQTKWVVFGTTAALGGFLAIILLLSFLNLNAETIRGPSVLVSMVVNAAIILLLSLIPISLMIAILRYRLWDIDLLIRRTVIYSILTSILALVYFGAVVLLQQLFRALTSAGGDIAIIISTLAIAALFSPLRKRVQDVIDQRFYRRKYDAQKVLAQFAQTARDETNLEKLTDELMRVVDETMQPHSVSLWLKKTEQDNQQYRERDI